MSLFSNLTRRDAMKTLFSSVCLSATLYSGAAFAEMKVDPSDWAKIEEAAKGQKVYWHAWGGDDRINAYIDWAGSQLSEKYGVEFNHVKVSDTANVVSQVVAEKAAGKNEGGSVDLIWINGENFASMKEQGLLFAPDWTTKLPNWKYVDFENKPTITNDFTIATDGLESPWGMAKMVFFHDTAKEKTVPDNINELLAYAKENPGRVTYPLPPDFIGSSFLKQALSELVEDASVLQKPVVDAEFEGVTAPLFAYLDEFHKSAWREGKTFPKSYPDMLQLMADSEIDIAFAFNPAAASSAIQNDELPDTVRSFMFSGGTLSNTHFVAIPYNSAAKEAALLLANILISPEAQLRKQDPEVWGDPTVLNIASLSADEQKAFNEMDLGVATLPPSEWGPALPEPHASWMSRIEEEWQKRYASGK